MIARLFLRAKHWQIFLLLFAIPTAAEIAAMGSVPPTVRSLKDLGEAGLLFGGMMVLYMFCFLAWFWSMGSFLSSIVKPALKLKMGFFRFALVYPALYIFAFLPVLLSPEPAWLAAIVPFHLFAMFCLFYSLYFVSRNLVLAEKGEPASFYDYAGPFFLIWFYPIGVWIVQPRINRLYAEGRNAERFTGTEAG